MKRLHAFLLAILLAACSPGNKETTSQDSTAAVADTASIADAESSEVDDNVTMESGVDYSPGDSGEPDSIDTEFDSWVSEIDSLSTTLHKVTISVSGYEAQAGVTWLFNSDVEPVYFSQEYSVEGSDGTTEYYIEAGQVVCALIVENIVRQKWCVGTNGRNDMTEGSDEPTSLGAEFGVEQNKALQRYRDELNSLLSLEVVSDEGGEVTLRYEATENYGDNESKTVTEVTMPKVLYKKMTK